MFVLRHGCSKQLLPKELATLLQTAKYAVASTEAKPELLSKNMSFRPAYDSGFPAATRPMAVIFSWLVAKSKHIYKYGDFYLGKGFDVLHVKIFPDQLLWPRRTEHVIKDMLTFVGASARAQQPLLIHGFSVGGYLYGESLVRIVREPEAHGHIGARIAGQVFDSPVDCEGVPRGLGMALTPIPALQKTIKAGTEAYLRVFDRQVMAAYRRSSDTYRENPLRTPSLMLYSTSDPIGIPGPIEGVIADWRARGISVTSHCWHDTKHVSHFHRHPVQYIGLLNHFLGHVGLIQDTPDHVTAQQMAQ